MPDLVKVAMDLWRSGLHACAFPRILEMSQIPRGWLMKKEGVEGLPLKTTGFYDDRCRPLFFYQKDIIAENFVGKKKTHQSHPFTLQ